MFNNNKIPQSGLIPIKVENQGNLLTTQVNKINFTGKIFFNKKYPNGVLNKDLNIDIMKKLRWKHKISLNRGLDIILRELKI